MLIFKAIKVFIAHYKRVGMSLTSLAQFIYYNFVCKRVKSNFANGSVLIPYKNCHISIAKDAILVLEGPFFLGIPSLPGSRKNTYLVLNDKSKLIIRRSCRIIDDSSILLYKNAYLDIGDFHSNTDLEINCGDKIILNGEITCGRHVRIKDYNGHYVSYENYPKSAPVIIDNHVWLCTGTTVNPGVHIYEGCVIGDNANVVTDVPANTFSIGNPACIVKEKIQFSI